MADVKGRAPDIDFWVPGLPAPQGSKRHVGNGRRVKMSKKIGPWRKAVTTAAPLALPAGHQPLDGPLVVAVDFCLARTSSAPVPRFILPGGPPDVDKLVRGALDPLTQSGVIHDDSRIVDSDFCKRFVPTDYRHRRPGDYDAPGALFALWVLYHRSSLIAPSQRRPQQQGRHRRRVEVRASDQSARRRGRRRHEHRRFRCPSRFLSRTGPVRGRSQAHQ